MFPVSRSEVQLPQTDPTLRFRSVQSKGFRKASVKSATQQSPTRHEAHSAGRKSYVFKKGAQIHFELTLGNLDDAPVIVVYGSRDAVSLIVESEQDGNVVYWAVSIKKNGKAVNPPCR